MIRNGRMEFELLTFYLIVFVVLSYYPINRTIKYIIYFIFINLKNVQSVRVARVLNLYYYLKFKNKLSPRIRKKD